MRGFLRSNNSKKGWHRAAPLICCVILTGCGTVVTPPVNPTNPQVIYLCDYGIHSSLLLPVGNKKYVEFLYGDWNWAALGHNSPLDAVGALFFSQQSTLGRRYILQANNEAMPTPLDGPKSEMPIIVNGDDCDLLVRKLMLRWDGHRQTAITTGSTLSYVKDTQPYSITHDCNHLTTECLRAMGCKVEGDPFWSNYKVVNPDP
jgi:hypothetical protein